MKALVTGAAGFVGQHLVAHLRTAGDTVTEVDYHGEIQIDVTNLSSVTECFRLDTPDVVYHLAGDADVAGSWDHPQRTFRTNAEGTLNVLGAARAAGVARVLTIISADIYGTVSSEELPLDEHTPLRPVSPYAASKVAADFIADQAFRGYNQDVIRLRPFNHIGPGQRPDFVAPALARRIALNERSANTSVKVGNLTPRRDFTDVRDVVRAYRLVAERGEAGAVYNVCRGEDVSIGDLATTLCELAEGPMELETDPDLQRPVDIPVLLGDHSRLTAATGWEPTIALRDTLQDLLNDMRAQVASEGNEVTP